MAAITPTTFAGEEYYFTGTDSDSTRPSNGDRYMMIPWTSSTVADDEVWNSGIGGATFTAWTAVDSSDEVSATASDGLARFDAPAGEHNGYLHIWGPVSSNSTTTASTTTPDEATAEEKFNGVINGVRLSECKLRMYTVVTTGSGDTWTSGLDDIVAVAYRDAYAPGAPRPCAVTFSGDVITFTYSGGTAIGTLLVWTRGH